MLEKPDIPEAIIISRLQEEYDLHVSTLTFLPLGADMGTAVYRVVAVDGAVYFLKLRKGFDEISRDRSALSQVTGNQRDHRSV